MFLRLIKEEIISGQENNNLNLCVLNIVKIELNIQKVLKWLRQVEVSFEFVSIVSVFTPVTSTCLVG